MASKQQMKDCIAKQQSDNSGHTTLSEPIMAFMSPQVVFGVRWFARMIFQTSSTGTPARNSRTGGSRRPSW